MKKSILPLILIALISAFSSFSNATHLALAEEETGYLIKNDTIELEDCFEIVTNYPWEDGAKWEILFEEQSINKEYLVFDYDVTLSKKNPELVAKIGLDGKLVHGQDGEYYHGSNDDVLQNYGNWLFFKPGRNQAYIPMDDFYELDSSLVNMFGIYFDTGFDDRSGSSINIYGLYLADTYEEKLENNLIVPSDYQGHDDLISTKGVDLTFIIDQSIDSIGGAFLYSDYIGAMKLHIKSASEGGKAIKKPDDYGYVTITLDNAINVSKDEGFAFSVFAINGETFFRIVLEDENGYFYMPNLYGGSQDEAETYPMMSDSIILSIRHFYGALYLNEKENGTVYIPYSSFVGLDYMFEKTHSVSSNKIQNIKRIHVGMDMEYGLGRNVVINEFASCNLKTEKVKSIVRLANLNSAEWNRSDFSLSNSVSILNTQTHKDNCLITSIDEDEVPGAKGKINLDEINSAIALAKSLNEQEYTKESWSNMKIKLENAENLVQYSVLYEQKDFDDAYKELLLAIRSLKYVNDGSQINTKNVCGGNIISTNIFACAASLTALLLLLINRRKKRL